MKFHLKLVYLKKKTFSLVKLVACTDLLSIKKNSS